MHEFFAAVMISMVTANTVMNVWPYRTTDQMRVVTVSVCNPKDQGHIIPGMMIPRLVATERIVAANITPATQAAEQRGKKRR